MSTAIVPELHTVEETARLLRLSKRAVYLMVEAGVLEAYRIGVNGGAVRVPATAVLTYLRACRVGKKPAKPEASSELSPADLSAARRHGLPT